MKSQASTKANSPNIELTNCSQFNIGYSMENGGFGGMLDFKQKNNYLMVDT